MHIPEEHDIFPLPLSSSEKVLLGEWILVSKVWLFLLFLPLKGNHLNDEEWAEVYCVIEKQDMFTDDDENILGFYSLEKGRYRTTVSS